MSLVIEPMPALGVTRVSRWIFNCYVIHDGQARPGRWSWTRDCPALLMTSHRFCASPRRRYKRSSPPTGTVTTSPVLPGLRNATAVAIYLPERTLGYLDGQRPRTPSTAKVAAIWPTIVGQPFDRAGAAGLVRGSRFAGFGTQRGMLWTGPTPTGPLLDGQCLPGAPAWRVIAAPGHTDDSVVLWNETNGTLISGDAVISARGQAWITPETVDTAAARTTAQRLTQLSVKHLLPGHGKPVHHSVWASRRS